MRASKRSRILTYLIFSLGALLILFPIYITLATTFTTASESSISFFTLPKSLCLGNDISGNSLLIIAVSLAGEPIILPHGLRPVPLHEPLQGVPRAVLLLPDGHFPALAGTHDTRGRADELAEPTQPPEGTLLYMAHAACESMFLYVGCLATVSTTIEEAAYIDGASTFQIYTRVILPLMTPILSTVVIREGLAIWNDFQMPLITLNRSSRLWTPTIYLNNFSSEYSVDYIRPSPA